MKDITIERSAVNIEGLDAELRAALGAAVSGISVGRGVVVVHLTDAATSQQIDQARQIVANHDPARLTPSQQAQADLIAERALYTTPVNPDTITLPELAARFAWLEREVRHLRGL